MSPIAISTIILLILLFLNVPVFLAVLSGCIVYFIGNQTSAVLLAQRVISGMESIPMLAVPFFVATGVFMNYSGITERMLKFCKVLTGHMTGGLAQVNIILSTLMGGMSGSSLADAAMEAKMLVPEMEKAGFPRPFSTAVTAASSIITPLIPPGIAAIIYGSVTNTSIGRLFVAGIVPAIILCVTMMVLVAVISKKHGYKPIYDKRASLMELWESFKPAFFPLLLPFIIIGGIRFGVFTPTEAGAVAILYSLILGFCYKTLKFKHLILGIKETVISTGTIMVIVGSAACFAWVLTAEMVPQTITNVLISFCKNKYIFLLVVNLFLLIVGMFIEATAAQIVLAPMLVPVALAFGIDPVHFGMVFIFNMASGSLTPPMGNLMFVACGATKCKTEDFIKASIPFYLLLLGALLLMTYLPAVTTVLPNLVYGA